MIVVGLLYLLHFSIGYAVMLRFLCIGLLYAYDEQALNASRWAKDECMRKDFRFMALKAMPIWLILGLDVMEFLNSRSLVKNVWIIRLDLTRIKKIWSMKRWMFEDFNLSSWH